MGDRTFCTTGTATTLFDPNDSKPCARCSCVPCVCYSSGPHPADWQTHHVQRLLTWAREQGLVVGRIRVGDVELEIVGEDRTPATADSTADDGLTEPPEPPPSNPYDAYARKHPPPGSDKDSE